MSSDQHSPAGGGSLSQDALAAHGAETIAAGSKSFALASTMFGNRLRTDVQMLYAWCRYCDDVIDGQTLGEDAPDIHLSAQDQADRLARLKADTARAFAGEPTGHAAFDGLSLVVRRHKIPQAYAFDLLDGFAMDVSRRSYQSLDDTLSYCYGVAGAVGIMMAIVMGVEPQDDATLDRACDLGLAFQLTNICRDIVDDARADRLYLPAALLEQYGIAPTPGGVLDENNRGALAMVANQLLDEADRYYSSATIGIGKLPPRAGAAIAAARNIYRDIGALIRRKGGAAWNERAYTSKSRKVALALSGSVSGIARASIGKFTAMPAREGLWQRPKH